MVFCSQSVLFSAAVKWFKVAEGNCWQAEPRALWHRDFQLLSSSHILGSTEFSQRHTYSLTRGCFDLIFFECTVQALSISRLHFGQKQLIEPELELCH